MSNSLNMRQVAVEIDSSTNLNSVSTLNSTSTPLGISGVFTGTVEDISRYSAITVAVFSNKGSATDGLSIQFSSDGINFDHVDTHTVSANISHVTTNAPQGKYFRVVYTNGVLAQTAFRLQVLYYNNALGPIIEEMDGDVSDTTSTLTTKAVIFAKNPAGAYGAVGRTTGGNLKVSIEEQDAGAGLATSAKQDAQEATLAKIPGLSIPIHDYIALSYTGSNLTGVVYKTGGAGGTTVSTLVLVYTGSVLTSVTKT